MRPDFNNTIKGAKIEWKTRRAALRATIRSKRKPALIRVANQAAMPTSCIDVFLQLITVAALFRRLSGLTWTRFGFRVQTIAATTSCFVFFLLVGLVVAVESYDPLPNGDGYSFNNPLRKVISDWVAGGATQAAVLATYGNITTDWNLTGVTNMGNLFFAMNFNGDISKWNTGAVIYMESSKSFIACCFCCVWPLFCVVVVVDSRF